MGTGKGEGAHAKGVHLWCECNEVQPKERTKEKMYFNPSFISARPLLRPLPFFHPCTLSVTGSGKFPRVRGSPLLVSSDTVIRSVGTESIPRSEPQTPSLPSMLVCTLLWLALAHPVTILRFGPLPSTSFATSIFAPHLSFLS
ncbi:hypothetical protein AMECASPLE_033163 [Ameca splendens]|uniref:Uncharacterized protein n=1 Tax=Ameca splendens TaxID=208324 RepID=A0ABV0Y713_9TELE